MSSHRAAAQLGLSNNHRVYATGETTHRARTRAEEVLAVPPRARRRCRGEKSTIAARKCWLWSFVLLLSLTRRLTATEVTEELEALTRDSASIVLFGTAPFYLSSINLSQCRSSLRCASDESATVFDDVARCQRVQVLLLPTVSSWWYFVLTVYPWSYKNYFITKS